MGSQGQRIQARTQGPWAGTGMAWFGEFPPPLPPKRGRVCGLFLLFCCLFGTQEGGGETQGGGNAPLFGEFKKGGRGEGGQGH